MIELAGITRCYGDTKAVTKLDLKVPASCVFGYLGPNGAGKTTTIKMMVGLLRPDEGGVIVDGVDAMKNPREANRRIGYVPDQPYLYDKLSGREVLQFVAGMYGMSASETKDSIAEQVERFALSPFIDRLTESYSHGMKQRVVFAAALVHKPQVLILDEPMVGLDPKSMRLVKDLLREEAGSGTTVFMSTHTLSVAEEIADCIGILDHGRLRFLGTVDELRSELATEHGSLEDLYLTLTAEIGTETPPPGSPEMAAGAE